MLLSMGCSNDDDSLDLFEDTPSGRIDARIDELKNLLVAPAEGYKVTYFPKNNEYGGFTFYMNFDTNGDVAMTSDVNSDLDITSSKYDVILGSTIELSFSTRNHIHKLSDSAILGLIGSGYEGNSNFQYIENREGTLFFKEARNNAELLFEPVTDPTAWDNVAISLANRNRLTPTIDSSVFQQLIITDSAGNTTGYELNYDTLRYFANPLSQSEDGTITELKFGIAGTESGIVVSPPIETAGAVFENFTYDTTLEVFIAENAGATATIGFGNEPAFVTDDIDLIANGTRSIFGYRPGFGNARFMSDKFFNNFNAISTTLGTIGETMDIYYIQIDFSNPNNPFAVLVFRTNDAAGNLYIAHYLFIPRIEDNKLFLTYNGPTDIFGAPLGNGQFYEPVIQSLLSFWASPDGLIYRERGSFTSFNNSFPNASGSFTSLSDNALQAYTIIFR